MKLNRCSIELAVAIAGGIALLAAPAAAYLPPAYGGRVVAPLFDEPVTLDPAEAARESELQICSLVYDTLFVTDGGRQPLPHLALAAPEVSADQRTQRVAVRPGVLFHDGRPLTAADVVAALRRLQQRANGYLLAPVRAISADPDGAVVFELRRPTPELALLLSAPATAIVRPSGRGIVGSGPLRVASRRAGGALRLVANVRHFGGRPYLDEVQFKVYPRSSAEAAAFQVGALQLSMHGASIFGGSPKHGSATVDTAPTGTAFLAIGRGQPWLGDRLLRAALSAAVDRRRLQRLAGTGRVIVADGAVSPRLARSSAPRQAFDRAQARRLLARVAEQHAALRQGGRIPLTLLVDASRADDRNIAQQLVADLDRIGAAATIDARPAAEYQARLAGGRYELALGRLAVQVPERAALIAGALAAAGDRAAALRCLAAASCGPDEERRFAQTLPFVPLVHPSMRVHFDPRLERVRPALDGRLPYATISWKRAR